MKTHQKLFENVVVFCYFGHFDRDAHADGVLVKQQVAFEERNKPFKIHTR